MQTASLGGFFQMIIEIIIFYYVIKFVARLFMPYIIKKAADKVKENLQNQFNNVQQKQAYQQKNDGVIIDDSKIDKNPKSNNKLNQNVQTTLDERKKIINRHEVEVAQEKTNLNSKAKADNNKSSEDAKAKLDKENIELRDRNLLAIEENKQFAKNDLETIKGQDIIKKDLKKGIYLLVLFLFDLG